VIIARTIIAQHPKNAGATIQTIKGKSSSLEEARRMG